MRFSENRTLYILYFLTICVSFLLIGGQGHNSDMNCWFGWTDHLRVDGYEGLGANYPPLYIHWLWIVAKWYTFTGTEMAKDLLFKIMVIFPVIISHLLLVRLVYISCRTHVTKESLQWAITLITLFNPAIFFDGVIWGQVDLIPAVIACYALHFLSKPKQSYWSMPLLVVALLCKFQMLVFFPIISAYTLKKYRQIPAALGLSIVAALLILTPYLVNGNTQKMFTKAYIQAPSMYPYSTMNGANLWLLLTENKAPDSKIILSNAEPESLLHKAITPRGIGIIVFFIFSCIAFIAMFRNPTLERTYFYSVVLAMVFFVFSTGMHERYLFAAIPICLYWVTYKHSNIAVAAILSLLCYANMHLVITIETDWLWHLLSALLVLTLFAILIPSHIRRSIFARIVSLVPNRRVPTLPLMLGITLLFFFYNTLILPGKESFSIELTDNQQWVYNLPQLHKHQGYGKMRVGRSVDNNTLRVQDTLYTQGIGSHAPSTVTYKLPKNSRAFDALVAADDESTSASIEFKVMLDTTEVWSSGTMKSGDKKRACHVDIDGHSKITLIISEGSSMSGDHADWLLPRITIEEE